MKILINTPDINGLGGVSNHYLGLKNYWNLDVKYNNLGNKKTRNKRLPYTILKYIYYLLFFRPNVVVINPSMGKNALIRDFVYLKIAKLFRRKVVCFIHGFNLEYAENANWVWLAKNLNRADCIIVLAQQFKNILEQNGIKTNIKLSTTKVMDTLIDGYDVSVRTGEVNNILLLSRIERAKGIYEAVDTFAILKKSYPNLALTFVGNGTELSALEQYVDKLGLKDIRFTGGLSGNALVNEYKNADLFFFPTQHGEGMPTVVLEAMAFGLPIITRAVGGVCDFFEDGKMGCITETKNPEVFAQLIEPYLNNPMVVHEISKYNSDYAKRHFMASIVASKLEQIFIEL